MPKIVMVFGIAEAKKKKKHSIKQKTEAKSNVIFGMQQDFSIAFPGSLPKPKIDSTGIMTKFGGTKFGGQRWWKVEERNV